MPGEVGPVESLVMQYGDVAIALGGGVASLLCVLLGMAFVRHLA